jgi:hypothetical protein
MPWIVILFLVLATLADANTPKKKLDAGTGFNAPCTPKVVKRAPRPTNSRIRVRKGEKPSRFLPVIAFQIEESGEVKGARVKRSSGIADIDLFALNWVRGRQYNARPGCGVIDSQAVVNVDWSSAE